MLVGDGDGDEEREPAVAPVYVDVEEEGERETRMLSSSPASKRRRRGTVVVFRTWECRSICRRIAGNGRLRVRSSPSRRMDSKRTLNATSHVGEPTPVMPGSGDAVCDGRLLEDDELSALRGDLASSGELIGESGRL